MKTQAAVMYDDGPTFTWQAMLGGDARFPSAALAPALQTALGLLAVRDPRLREGLPLAQPAAAWRALGRELLHEAVDILFAETSFVEDSIALFRTHVETFRTNLRSLIRSAQPPRPSSSTSPSKPSAIPVAPASAPSVLPSELQVKLQDSCTTSPHSALPTLAVPVSPSPFKEAAAETSPPSLAGPPAHSAAPTLSIPFFPFLYQDSVSPLSQSSLSAMCIVEASPNACQSLLLAVAPSNRKPQAVILKLYNRPNLFEATIADLCSQTVAIDLFIWNNNNESAARTVFEAKARAIACINIATVWLHHSLVNVYQV